MAQLSQGKVIKATLLNMPRFNVMAMIDINLIPEGDVVRFENVSGDIVVALRGGGVQGDLIEPYALGATYCYCHGNRWNPLSVAIEYYDGLHQRDTMAVVNAWRQIVADDPHQFCGYGLLTLMGH